MKLGLPAFILPGRWEERYTIVEEALRFILAEGVTREVSITIEEGVPSLGAYFLGMLPGLGFELAARIVLATPMSAMLKRVDEAADGEGELVVLDAGVLEEFSAVYGEAFADYVWPPTWHRHDAASWVEEFSDNLDDELVIGRRRFHHVGLRQDGRIVACCEVALGDGTLDIRNVGVLAAHQRRGLGSQLFVEQAAWARRVAGDDDLTVEVYTHRGWGPAMSFYRKLGFKRQRLYTVATARRG